MLGRHTFQPPRDISSFELLIDACAALSCLSLLSDGHVPSRSAAIADGEPEAARVPCKPRVVGLRAPCPPRFFPSGRTVGGEKLRDADA